jgi:Mycobacterium membrane protein
VGGALIAICAIGTAVIINSGDSATTKGTVAPPMPSRTAVSTPSAPHSTIPPSASPSPTRTSQLPPETVTTVPPSLSPRRAPTAAPAPTALPPSATLSPRTVVYTVTGTKQIVDLVNVVYTDARGYPQTVFNVALPWTKVVVLNPGVQTESVIASSFTSALDCSIVNAEGQTVIASAKSSLLATCTR